jgi:hypothetical protein
MQLLDIYLKSHHKLSRVTYVHPHLKCVDLLLCTRGSCEVGLAFVIGTENVIFSHVLIVLLSIF